VVLTNFSCAAECVHPTPPSLSEQLQVLEARLGIQPSGDVIVTPIGLEMFEIGRRILRDLQHIRDIMRT
jgi:DNA-binding transcriptional LysR family regulator